MEHESRAELSAALDVATPEEDTDEARPGTVEPVRSAFGDMPLMHARRGNIEKVMYINLARRLDRRRWILNELETLEIPEESITRIEAIDAAHCGESPLECCARSHIDALEQAISQDPEHVVRGHASQSD